MKNPGEGGMTLQQDVEALRKIPLFAKIEPSKLKLLAFTSEHVEFIEGEPICRQGEVGDAAYILLEGEADVLVDTQMGSLKVARLTRNDIVGEIAILCDVPRTATVMASSPLVTLRISKDAFFNLVTQFPHVGVEIMHELASRLHHTTQQVIDLSSKLQRFEKPMDGHDGG
jgi:CRP/FNR family transcriptional regulator, cyclic AMP receptor protein